MSFGGAASAETALRDRRILASLNMDGTQYGTWIKNTISAPVPFLESQTSPRKLSRFATFFKRSRIEVKCLLFSRAEHFYFTDVSLFSPAFKWMNLLGDVDGAYVINSMNRIVPDYFNTVLANKKISDERHVRPGLIEEPIN